jgi:type II secretory pathway component PulC
MKARSFLFAAAFLCACGGGSAPAETANSAKPAASDVALPARPGRLWRRDVVATLSRGLGDFLTRLELEPVLSGGKFRGWRIVKLRPGDPLWKGVDLAPGDVIRSVNGRPIERPEQALTAFQSLAVVGELRVAYERDGAPREIVYPIDDEDRSH